MTRELLTLVLISILLSGCISSPAPEKGTLQVTSSPSGAEIYLDNEYRGSTPATVSGIDPGNHTLEFRMSGFRSWKTDVTVAAGTSGFFAALTAVPLTATPVQATTVPESRVTLTARIGSEQMIVGESNRFSGTALGTASVKIILYGPGLYANGIILDTVRPDGTGDWSYTWNPGTRIQSGSYLLYVQDAGQITSVRVPFTVIGGGTVSVTPGSFAVAKGDAVTFSGRCTTGAPEVKLVLYGPERFGAGVDLGTFPVLADLTWSFRYTTDLSMPTGVYTIRASDVPETASGTSQFTIGFVS